jgi:hypothetical protein
MTLTTTYFYGLQSIRHSLRLVLMPPVVRHSLRLVAATPVLITLTTACFYIIPLLWLSLRFLFMASSHYDTHYGLFLRSPVVTTLTTSYCYDISSLWHSIRLIFLGTSEWRLWTQDLSIQQQRTVRVQQIGCYEIIRLTVVWSCWFNKIVLYSVLCAGIRTAEPIFILQVQADSSKNLKVLLSFTVSPWR